MKFKLNWLNGRNSLLQSLALPLLVIPRKSLTIIELKNLESKIINQNLFYPLSSIHS